MVTVEILLILILVIQVSGFLILGLLIHKWTSKRSTMNNQKPPIPAPKPVYSRTSPMSEHPMVYQKWREEVKRTIEYQCLSIRNAVVKQTIDIHQKEMELAPKAFLFDEEILREVYPPEQLDILNEYLATFHKYLELHWYTKERRLKSVFSGRISNIDSEAGRMVYRSKLVVNEFDRLYNQLTAEKPAE